MISDKDENYLDGIRNKDSEVIRKIYEQFHQAIVHLVETKQGTMEDACDVFQEGLMLVYQKARNPKFRLTSSFLTYFYAVCRNIWSNKRRKKSNQQVTIDEDVLSMQEELPTTTIERNEQYFLYRKKFLQLGKDCQKVLNLFLQKISMEKIMAEMGYSSIGYTKKRKFLCKEKLVKLIKNDPSYRELRF